MPVDGQPPGGATVFGHVVLGQLGDPADQHPEEQDERSPGPKIQWHGLVGEAAVKLLDMVALSEQALWFLTRGKWHVQMPNQAAAVCPLEEVAHGPAGGSAASQPSVQIRLGEIAQAQAALI
jgi:hypothetical protein